MSGPERLRDFLWEDIKQQHLGTFLKEVPLIDDEITIPRKDRRIDRGNDHIQARDGSRERCASGEVDYAPQQSQRQESKRQRNNQPFLQRYFGAVGGSNLPPLERLCRNLLHARNSLVRLLRPFALDATGCIRSRTLQ